MKKIKSRETKKPGYALVYRACPLGVIIPPIRHKFYVEDRTQ